MAILSVRPHPDDSAVFDAEARARFDEALVLALGKEAMVVSIGDRGEGSPFAIGSKNEYLVLIDNVRSGSCWRRLVAPRRRRPWAAKRCTRTVPAPACRS